MQTATIDNPGDVPAWGTYTIWGPLNLWTFQLGGGLVGSLALADGDVLRIFTAPDQQYALLTHAGVETDVTPLIPSIDWRPAPRGQAVPLNISYQGNGRMQAEFRPRFHRGY
jgi:hypothetical protein